MLYKVALSSTVLHVIYEATAAKSSLGRPILFVERQHSSAFTLSQNGAVTDKRKPFWSHSGSEVYARQWCDSSCQILARRIRISWNRMDYMIFASRSVWCIRFGFSHPHEYATVVCNYYLLVSVHAQAGLTDRILRPYTAISRKVVGKSARDYPRRYCGWFWVHWSSKKFERMALEAMEVCFRVIKKSNKSKQLQCQGHCIDHFPYYLSGL